jgi:CheY-like chemotaxis protein
MPSILIVEDDIAMSDILSLMLKFIGCKTAITPHPKAALEYLETSEVPDLFIVDFHMPYLDGPEFCQLLKEDPRTKDVPVVLLSGERSLENERDAKEAGAVEFLLKPVSLDDLKALLKRVLQFEGE